MSWTGDIGKHLACLVEGSVSLWVVFTGVSYAGDVLGVIREVV